ncbi:MAG: tetratricopeptide repeat protein [Flavobacteriaceae bacterium]|nr:tetratricopeptide repeat protein [Flavobacteriaceae bacterium]
MRSFVILFLICSLGLTAQVNRLAENYMAKGEYVKALALYEKDYESNPNNTRYINSLLKAYQALERFQSVDSIIEITLTKRPFLVQYFVEKGYNASLKGQSSEAEKLYQKALEEVEQEPRYSYAVARAFQDYNLLDYAIDTYEKAMKASDKYNFTAQLASLYGEKGDYANMFERYLQLIETNTSYRARALNLFSRYITEDKENEANVLLREALLKKIQSSQDLMFNSMLSWLFVQQNEFSKAFIQEKAIYNRTKSSLFDIQELADLSFDAENYSAAKPMYDFVLENAQDRSTRLSSERMLLKIKALESAASNKSGIEKAYVELLSDYQWRTDTYLIQLDYAELIAFEYKNIDKAKEILQQLVEQPFNDFQMARIKMLYADILVLEESFNRALIFYTQIQRALPNDVLAQEAQYKVAKTSFYKADFDYAETQLDVLSSATSKLIANDALKLLLSIRDNRVSDSLEEALKKYAMVDLKIYQQQEDQAIQQLEAILEQHKGNPIEDEVLLALAKLQLENARYNEAEKNLRTLLQNHQDSVYRDEALFTLAQVLEEQLNQPEAAKDIYEQLILNHADSVYVVEARKRYRKLRGDIL